MIGQGVRYLRDRFTPFLRELAHLAVGSDGQFLTLSGGKPAWGSLGISVYESPQQTITSAGALTLAHGLSKTPKMFSAYLVCQTAEQGYSVGDILSLDGFLSTANANTNRGFSLVPDATNLNIRFGATATAFAALHKTTGAFVSLTNANWKFVIIAVALP